MTTTSDALRAIALSLSTPGTPVDLSARLAALPHDARLALARAAIAAAEEFEKEALARARRPTAAGAERLWRM